jgi:hypothetical protein
MEESSREMGHEDELSSKRIDSRFQVSAWRDFLCHLHRIYESAQLLDGEDESAMVIAKDLQLLARQAIAYVETRNPKAGYAVLDKRESSSLNRKASMLRLLLSGSPMVEIAQRFGVSQSAVGQSINAVLLTLRKRSRLISKMSGRTDPLESTAAQSPSQMTAQQRAVYLACLDRYDIELERRAAGLPWDDVWRSWPQSS